MQFCFTKIQMGRKPGSLRTDKVPEAYDYHMTSFNTQAKVRVHSKSENNCLTAYLTCGFT